ncbi:MAG: protein TolR [Desulfohalobiaceae bacterium]
MDFNPRRGGFLAQINVVPFVDVMLVLLIIFMVTAPFLTQGVEVNLPQTQTVQTLPEDSQELVLSIDEEGKILLDEYQVKLDNLQEQLKKLDISQDQMLYLRADQEVAYGFVVQVMSEIRASGIHRIGVVAEPEQEED